MRTDRQKQQNRVPLLSSNPSFRYQILPTHPKPEEKAQKTHLRAQIGSKRYFPTIPPKKQYDPSHQTQRLKTESIKIRHQNGLQMLKNSIHQYKNGLNMQEDDEKLIKSRFKSVNQHMDEQYRPQKSHRLSVETNQDKQTLAFRSENESRKQNVKSSKIGQQQSTERTQAVGSIELWKEKFVSSVQSIPKNIKHKNEESLNESLRYLCLFNPFFQRNNPTTNLCLLKIGNILEQNRTLLYKRDEEWPYFYIVLLGKIKIQNGSLVKLCQTGQTLNEQIIFSPNEKKISFQKARVIGRSFLLEVSKVQWTKLTKKMLSHGYKREIYETEALIKRNYIIKSWLRNKARKENQI